MRLFETRQACCTFTHIRMITITLSTRRSNFQKSCMRSYSINRTLVNRASLVLRLQRAQPRYGKIFDEIASAKWAFDEKSGLRYLDDDYGYRVLTDSHFISQLYFPLATYIIHSVNSGARLTGLIHHNSEVIRSCSIMRRDWSRESVEESRLSLLTRSRLQFRLDVSRVSWLDLSLFTGEFECAIAERRHPVKLGVPLPLCVLEARAEGTQFEETIRIAESPSANNALRLSPPHPPLASYRGHRCTRFRDLPSR